MDIISQLFHYRRILGEVVQGPITHVATIPEEEEGVQGPSTRPGRLPLTRGVASDPAISRWDIAAFIF